MPESQYSMTYGIGVQTDLFGDHDLKVDYAYRAMGILGNVQSLGVSLLF
jgi:opacity protein-like surface antigen